MSRYAESFANALTSVLMQHRIPGRLEFAGGCSVNALTSRSPHRKGLEADAPIALNSSTRISGSLLECYWSVTSEAQQIGNKAATNLHYLPNAYAQTPAHSIDARGMGSNEQNPIVGLKEVFPGRNPTLKVQPQQQMVGC